MMEPMNETPEGTFSVLALESGRRITERKDVIAAGPGLSQHHESSQFMRTFLEKQTLPIVLDADGLNSFAGAAEHLHGKLRPLVVTPHPGEMARLTGKSVVEIQMDRVGTARKFAQEHVCYVVLKGANTVVAEPSGKVWINTTGNPGMATAGTGDVLTGVIAGLMAQFPRWVAECVIAAVHIHGLAGDLARDDFGEKSLVATDLLGTLPAAICQVTPPGNGAGA